MAVYDLQEQEQIDDLKAWWKQWGDYVTWAAVAVALALAAVQGWRWWTQSQAEKAGALYIAITSAQRANDLAKAKDAQNQLTSGYPGSGYAPAGAMILARMLFDSGDRDGAKAQLQWVIDKSTDEDAKPIARYRLAQIQFDAKEYDAALATLDAKVDPAYDGMYTDLRGDIFAAMGRTPAARIAYQGAVAKLDPKSPYRAYVQTKLDALGGAMPIPPEVLGGSSAATASGASPTVTPSGAPSPAPAASPAPAPGAPAPTPAATAPAPAAKTTPAPVTPAPAAAAAKK